MYGSTPTCSGKDRVGRAAVPHGSVRERMWPWIERELRAILLSDDTDMLVEWTVGMVESSFCGPRSDGSEYFPKLDALRLSGKLKVMLHEDAAIFCKELENFMLSGYDLATHERIVAALEEKT